MSEPRRKTGERLPTPPAPRRTAVPAGLAGVMQDAARDPGSPLDPGVRARLEARLGHDFARVRVHSGPASAEAARRLGARAYTLGNDVHLGLEGAALAGRERDRLLAHEAVHAAQQGGRSAAPRPGLAVAAAPAPETEARELAEGVAAAPTPSGPRSRSLALRDRVRGGALTPLAEPAVQPDLKKTLTAPDGSFDLDLKTEAHAGARNGMSGTIKFTADAAAPDSKNIRLLQVVRNEDLTTGKDYVWPAPEANRNKMMTSEDKAAGVQPGYFVDHSAAAATPRTAKTDPAVSPYYRDYWPNATKSQDGSKSGKTIKEASLWDFPSSAGNRRFSFETAAKAADTGYHYATVRWGFTISDAAKGKVEHEYATAHHVPSATFHAAVKQFNEFYRNPGSSKAP